MDITITRNPNPKAKPADESKLGFGRIFTDHMLLMDYDEGQGWHDLRIVPYGDFSLSPAAMVFHYAQEVFEGMKAYRRQDGGIQLFRPADNFARMNRSNERLCIPKIPEEDVLIELVRLEQDWVPSAEGTSLYIRPTIIATEPALGVKASSKYLFFIILSPVGAYYPEGLKPVRIYVEDYYVRATRGGTGETKCGGNYAASILAGEKAHHKGFSQVLWLDGVEKKYIEEVGSMNIFFKIDGKIVTPKLTGSILPGITRNSIIQLAKHQGLEVEERRIAVEELYQAYLAGKLEEVFGSGTAAVVSPVGELVYKDEIMNINNGRMGEFTRYAYNTLTGLQYGRLPDPFGWVTKL